MRIRVQPYGASNSARDIARSLSALGTMGAVLRLKNPERSRFRCRTGDLIVNWGSSDGRFPEGNYLNKPSAVALAANKLKTFQTLTRGDVRTPDWTTDVSEAQQWVREGNVVYARTKLSGNSGDGIVIIDNLNDFQSAPLYTSQYICDREFRIHVVNGRAFDVQEKKRRRLTDEEREAGITRTDLLRNHSNGWVFCREGVTAPLDAIAQAIKAQEALGLDFCGVDVGYCSDSDKAVIYEVNTACGVEATTLTSYTQMLSELIATRR